MCIDLSMVYSLPLTPTMMRMISLCSLILIHHAMSGMQLGLNNPLADSAPPVSPANSSSRTGVPGLAMESSVGSSRYSSRGGTATTPSTAVPNAVYVNGLPNSTTEEQLREVSSYLSRMSCRSVCPGVWWVWGHQDDQCTSHSLWWLFFHLLQVPPVLVSFSL